MSTPKTAVQEVPSTPQVRYGLIDIQVALRLQDAPGGATASARSGLHAGGTRGINVWLAPSHMLVHHSLHRSDNLTIRFLVGLALSEFCSFWSGTPDGAAVTRALKRTAGIQPREHAYGSGFASKLSVCESLRAVDGLPIFSRDPQDGPFDLFTLTIETRTPSDIQNWQLRDGETEAVRPIPKLPPTPMVKPSIPVTAVPEPDPFLAAFHDRAKELLSVDWPKVVRCDPIWMKHHAPNR